MIPESGSKNSRDQHVKAKDLKVVVKFERDDSVDGKMRVHHAKEIICQLILLGQKRGRPAGNEEILDEAA